MLQLRYPQVSALGESNNFCKHKSVELGCLRKHEGNTLMKYFRERRVWFLRVLREYHMYASRKMIQNPTVKKLSLILN